VPLIVKPAPSARESDGDATLAIVMFFSSTLSVSVSIITSVPETVSYL